MQKLGATLRFLAAAGEATLVALLVLAFFALAAYTAYRFYKATISTIHVVSEVVILGLFLTPPASLCAFLGNLLDTTLPLPWSLAFTAVGALIGLVVGVYLWLQFH